MRLVFILACIFGAAPQLLAAEPGHSQVSCASLDSKSHQTISEPFAASFMPDHKGPAIPIPGGAFLPGGWQKNLGLPRQGTMIYKMKVSGDACLRGRLIELRVGKPRTSMRASILSPSGAILARAEIGKAWPHEPLIPASGDWIAPVEWPEDAPYVSMEIVISNQEQWDGGARLPLTLSLDHRASSRQIRFFILMTFALGIAVFSFVYSASFWLKRRNDRASLCLCGASLTVLVRCLAMYYPWYLSKLFDYQVSSALIWNIAIRVEYATILCGGVATWGSCTSLLKSSFPRFTRSFYLGSLAGIVTLLVGPLEICFRSLPMLQLSFVLIIGLSIALTLERLYRKTEFAGALCLANVIIFVGLWTDVITYTWRPDGYYLFDQAMVVYIAVFSQIIATIYHKDYITARFLSNHLQSEVDRQTQVLHEQKVEIEAVILASRDYLFTIGDAHMVSPPFSPPFVKLFHEADRGAPIDLEGVCTVLGLDKQSIDTIRSVIHVSLGEDRLSFDLNQDALTFHSTLSINQAPLLIEFLPIVDKDNIVRRFLANARDISAQMTAMATERKKAVDAEVAVVMTSIDNKSAADLLMISERLDTQDLLSNMEHARGVAAGLPEILKTFHTYKGVARTLGLRDLSKLIHDIEQTLISLSTHQGLADKNTLHHIMNLLQLFLLYQKSVKTSYERIFKANSRETLDISQDLLQFRDKIETGTWSMLAGKYMRSARGVILQHAALAREACLELGKPPVDLVVSGIDIHLSDRMARALSYATLHFIKNSIDHGIERKEDRGVKPADRSVIQFVLSESSIIITDDGRGLDIKSLATKAGLTQINADNLVEILVNGGVSSKAEASEWSGRGFGFSAAVEELARVGFHVELSLSDNGMEGFRAMQIRLHMSDIKAA